MNVIGRIEILHIDLRDDKSFIYKTECKIDTGAYSSVIHMEYVDIVDDGIVIYINKELSLFLKTGSYKYTTVKSSNGVYEARVSTKLRVKLGNSILKTTFTFSNRNDMRYPILLGRRFLTNRFVVDTSKEFMITENERYDMTDIEDKKKLIYILSRNKKLYSTIRLQEEALNMGWDCKVIDYLKCSLQIVKGKRTIVYNGKVLPKPDAIIPRIGSSRTFYGNAVIRQFESMGVFTTVSSLSLSKSRDKLRSIQNLSRYVDIPKTVFASNKTLSNDAIELIGGTPCIIKVLEGTQGKGVVLADSYNGAKSVLDAFHNLDVNIMLQEYISESNGEDIRVFIVNGKAVGAMKRKSKEKEFRSNLHQGGTSKNHILKRKEKSVAIQAAKAMGLSVCGVDIILSNRGPLVLEVNSSPGLEGIENSTKLNIAKEVMLYIDKNINKNTKRRKGIKINI